MRERKPSSSKQTSALRSSFAHDVRPDEYAARISSTTMVAALVIAGIYAFQNGSFQTDIVVPMNGWHPRSPSGALYIETWSAILSDAAQVGFGLWGGVLLVKGLWYIAREGKFAPIYFSLGVAFVGMAVFIPALFPILSQWLMQHYPALGG
jgi:hypothetical protein